jgi:cold shock CspA family protein
MLALTVVSPALAGSAETVRDEFKSTAFDGDDGTIPWASDWLEFPVGDGPTTGQIQVVSNAHCAAGKCLRLGDETLVAGIYREVDLSSVTSATLTYSYRRSMSGDGSGGRVRVVAAPDVWSPEVLASYNMDGDDAGQVAATIDLSSKTGANLWVGFLGEGKLDGFMYIDNVQVSMSSNRAPVFTESLPNRSDTEGDSVSISPQVSDPEEDVLSFSATGLPAGVSIDDDSGLITGTVSHNAAASSPHTTVVTVSDGENGTATESFTWTIADLNRSPTLAPLADIEVGEAEVMQVTANAADPDLPSDTLTFALTAAPTGATVDSTGRIKWTPPESAGPGTYGFTVEVTDSGDPALSATASFDVTVGEVNSAPALAAIPDQANGVGDAVSLSVKGSDSDIPANTLTYSAVGLPSGVTISPTSGLISGTIANSAAQSNNTVTVTVKDNGSPRRQASQSFSWQVTEGNHAPVLAPVSDQQPNASGVVTFIVEATDGDPGDTLNFWLADGIDAVPGGASINSVTGKFTWTPTEDQHDAVYRINVGVSDTGAPRLSDTQLVKITVPKPNQSPQVTSPGNQSSAEGESINLAVAATDPDGDTLRYAATGLPSGLQINSSTGVVTGEIGFEEGAQSPFDVKVTVTDSGTPQKADTAEFQWTVAETNRPPVAIGMTLLVIVGEPTEITLEAEDPDGDEIEYIIAAEPITGRLEGEAPNLIYTTPGGADRDSFSFAVTDGEFEVMAQVVVEVRASNTPPDADADEYEVQAGETLRVDAPGVLGNDSDVDAEDLTVSVVSQPAHGTLVLAADGSFTYVPNEGYAGGDKFIYAAVDAFGERATATVVVNVIAPVVVVPPPVEDGPKSDVVAASAALWQPVVTESRPLMSEVRRAVVAAVNAGITTLPEMRFPLLLLAIALLLGLTVGRVSVLPIGGGKREEVGWVQSYDETHQVGRVLSEDGEAEVFIHGRALDKAHRIEAGQRVRYVAADMRGRRIALKVWPASTS